MVKKNLLFLLSCLSLSGLLFSSDNKRLFKKIQPVVLAIHSHSTEEQGQVLDIVNKLSDSDKEKFTKLADTAPVANMLFKANLDDTKKAVAAMKRGEVPSNDCAAKRDFMKYDETARGYILKGNNIAHFIFGFLNNLNTIEKGNNKVVQTAICCANVYLTLNNQATYGYVLPIN